MTSEPDVALAAQSLSCGYGDSVVVRDLDLEVRSGEIVALLGANGAGKTTTLLTLAGVLSPVAGEIRLFGERCTGTSAAERARRGVSLIPDDRGLFPKLTVRENIMLATRRRRDTGALELFPELSERLSTPAGLLSGGQQQMLAIARAMATRPRLLLLDELSLGLAPVVVQRLLPVVSQLSESTGCAVLIVEQHVHLALSMATRAYVLSHGKLVLSGSAAHLRDNPDLLHASYLGSVDEVADPSAIEHEVVTSHRDVTQGSQAPKRR